MAEEQLQQEMELQNLVQMLQEHALVPPASVLHRLADLAPMPVSRFSRLQRASENLISLQALLELACTKTTAVLIMHAMAHKDSSSPSLRGPLPQTWMVVEQILLCNRLMLNLQMGRALARRPLH